MVVVWAHVEVVEEGQHLGAMAAQPFDKALGVTVRPGGGDELIEPSMEPVLAPFVTVRRQFPTALPETHGIAQQTSEFFAEASPGRASSELVDLHELGKEVKVALLLGERLEGVVGAPEVGNEDPGEHRSEDGLDHRGAAVPVDQVVAALARGEGPQPVGNPIDPPASLIGMQHGAGAHLLADPLVRAFQELREVLPRLGQPAGTDGKAEQRRGDFHTVADADADRVMQPGAEHDKVQPQGRVRQGRRDRRRYDLATGATPIAVDRVFGDLGGDRGNVFNNARVGADRLAELGLTMRTFAQAVFLVMIDMIRRGTMLARMAALAAGPSLASPRGRLGVYRAHPRGGGGTVGGVLAFLLQPLPLFGFLTQLKDGADRLFARQLKQRDGLLAPHRDGVLRLATTAGDS